MTAPLTEPDCDLRDFQFMPLDVVRLAQSDLIATEDPAAIVANLLLWCASWHQVPAASLTDDARSLARLAGYGRGVAEFEAIRAGALRGWIKCSDGRLYHPVVAEKAREAFKGKLAQRHRTFLAAVRKHNERDRESGGRDQRRPLGYDEWIEAGRPSSAVKDAPKAAEQPLLPLDPDRVTRDEPDMSRVTSGNVTRDEGGMSRQCHAEKRSKGEGQGEGQGQGDSYNDDDARGSAKSEDEERDDLLGLASRLAREGGVNLNPAYPDRFARELDIVKAWLADGIDVEETILPTIRDTVAKATDTVGSLKFFDGWVRKAHARKIAKGTAVSAEVHREWTPERKAEYAARMERIGQA